MFHIVLPIVTGIIGTLFGVFIMALLTASKGSTHTCHVTHNSNIDANKLAEQIKRHASKGVSR